MISLQFIEFINTIIKLAITILFTQTYILDIPGIAKFHLIIHIFAFNIMLETDVDEF